MAMYMQYTCNSLGYSHDMNRICGAVYTCMYAHCSVNSSKTFMFKIVATVCVMMLWYSHCNFVAS